MERRAAREAPWGGHRRVRERTGGAHTSKRFDATHPEQRHVCWWPVLWLGQCAGLHVLGFLRAADWSDVLAFAFRVAGVAICCAWRFHGRALMGGGDLRHRVGDAPAM